MTNQLIAAVGMLRQSESIEGMADPATNNDNTLLHREVIAECKYIE